VPAAAVIPAPIAYTKVVAVKKLVVGPRCGKGRLERVELVCRDGMYQLFPCLFERGDGCGVVLTASFQPSSISSNFNWSDDRFCS